MLSAALDPVLRIDGDGLEGLADENVKARSRGVLLMAISNARGRLLLSTSNKSELAVGYSTLYGDMCGGLAPIGDLWKTEVFELARWMNDHHRDLGFERPPIPVSSIEKPPSAELRPDQRDEDSLPPYEVLDAYLRAGRRGAGGEEIASTFGIDDEVVSAARTPAGDQRVQAMPGDDRPMKLAPRTFGRPRRPGRVPMESLSVAQPASGVPTWPVPPSSARAKRFRRGTCRDSTEMNSSRSTR